MKKKLEVKPGVYTREIPDDKMKLPPKRPPQKMKTNWENPVEIKVPPIKTRRASPRVSNTNWDISAKEMMETLEEKEGKDE